MFSWHGISSPVGSGGARAARPATRVGAQSTGVVSPETGGRMFRYLDGPAPLRVCQAGMLSDEKPIALAVCCVEYFVNYEYTHGGPRLSPPNDASSQRCCASRDEMLVGTSVTGQLDPLNV